MTLDEIIKQKKWWYLKEYTYIMDDNWVNEFKKPAPYPAFIWWNQYTFRTPRLYFRVVVREHTEEKRNEISKTDLGRYIYQHQYNVIIMGERD